MEAQHLIDGLFHSSKQQTKRHIMDSKEKYNLQVRQIKKPISKKKIKMGEGGGCSQIFNFPPSLQNQTFSNSIKIKRLLEVPCNLKKNQLNKIRGKMKSWNKLNLKLSNDKELLE